VYGQYDPAKAPVTVTSKQLMTSFKQGTARFSSITYGMTPGGGNCASIAIIKAALGSYGLYGVFQSVSVDKEKKVYTIYLRNGEKVDLSFDRYKMAADYFAYDKKRVGSGAISKEILEYSKFCFAVMARVKQLKRTKFTEKYFYHAVDNLNKGEGAETIHELLGLPSYDISDPSTTKLNIEKHMMVWNGPHAVYAYNGEYDEAFVGVGSDTGIEKLSTLETEHCDEEKCPILGAYKVK
jgi:hypothetical protein